MTTIDDQIDTLEKKLAGIKNTKSRMDILSSLTSSYSGDIYNSYDKEISAAKKGLEFKNPDQKKDVETIIKAIKNVIGDKYNFRYEVVCKIADGNSLTFNLDFNEEKIPSVASATKLVQTLESKKAADEKRLMQWKRDMLYKIANGDDFTEFTVKSQKKGSEQP
jgi:hypothetical protein